MIKKRGTLNASRRKNKGGQSKNTNDNGPDKSTENNKKQRASSIASDLQNAEDLKDNDDMMPRETEAFHEAAFWRGDVKDETDIKKHSIRKKSLRKTLNQDNQETPTKREQERETRKKNTSLQSARERLGNASAQGPESPLISINNNNNKPQIQNSSNNNSCKSINQENNATNKTQNNITSQLNNSSNQVQQQPHYNPQSQQQQPQSQPQQLKQTTKNSQLAHSASQNSQVNMTKYSPAKNTSGKNLEASNNNHHHSNANDSENQSGNSRFCCIKKPCCPFM